MLFPSGIYFDIQIDDYVGFIQLNDVVSFEMIETTGIELPTVEALFVTTDKKVKDMLLENNIIKILIGESKSSYEIFEVSVLEKDARNHQENSYSCYFKGFVGDKRFLVNKLQVGFNGDPLQAMDKACKSFSLAYGVNLKLESYIANTLNIQKQTQNWFTIDETYRSLLVEMWAHLDIRPSFPLTALNRYGKLLLKDFNSIISGAPKWNFTQGTYSGEIDNLSFVNPFAVKNDTEIYNIYAGYGKVVNIYDAEKGQYGVHVHDPVNLMGASQERDTSKAGDRNLNGYKQSSNVAPGFHETYFYNVARLMSMSSICGFTDFVDVYNPNLNLLDYVNLTLSDPEQGKALSGRYLVHTIAYNFSSTLPFLTRVFISRDCNNNIENNIASPDTGIKIESATKESILENTKLARTLLASIRSYVNGTFYNEILNYFSNLKSSLLGSFSIEGTTINLNSQLTALSSFNNLGNNIFHKLLDIFVPANVQQILQTQGWGSNLNLANLLNSIIQQYVPPEIYELYRDLLLTINDINVSLQKTRSSVIDASGVNATMLPASSNTSSTRVNNIVKGMLNNIQELSIPIPVINLTESEQLLSEDNLNILISNTITSDLLAQGYLDGFNTSTDSIEVLSTNNFKQILLGIVVIDTLTINTINNNVNSTLYARYWGSFHDINEITNYSAKKGFQDYSRLPDCTKVISALAGSGIYVVLPQIFSNPIFTVNGSVVEMNSDYINLLVFDASQNPIDYRLYYTPNDLIFNSSSTTLVIS